MIGHKLSDRYEITSELGRGGMGVVYRAADPLLHREVAVKIVAPALLAREIEQRFEAEAQIVAQMDHPSIVPIYDFGRHEGSLFFVMPLLAGASLHELIRAQALTLGDILDIGVGVADALSYSHARGVIHRDIKPENIMVSREEGGQARVRVMDFGLARRTTVTGLTKTGVLVGTVSYVSPEQVTGRPVDARSDLYSLGTVLYNCIANDVPFGGELQSVLYRIVHEVPQPPRALGADIDEELETIILSCLAKEPERRPQTAVELQGTLAAYRAKLQDSQRMKSVTLDRPKELRAAALSPFVGRAEELAELQHRLNAAVSGECQFVVISGEPGVGKTRLLDELEALTRARRIRSIHGRTVERDHAFPYHGFCEAIQEFFRRRETASAETELPDLSDLAADLVAQFPLLSEIEAIRTSAAGLTRPAAPAAESRSADRTQVFELLARTLVRLSAGEPLVLVLEDLHGADVSIEALAYIVRRLGPTPTLIVATYRSAEIDRRHPLAVMLERFQGERRFSAIALAPFSPAVHREYLTTLVGGGHFAEALAERLYEASEGNPFFTKELIRSLLDSGNMVQNERGAWTMSGGTDLSSEALPATIQQAVERRIGRLPAELLEMLSVASVMGKTFEFRDLEALSGEREDLDEAVEQLAQQGLVEEERRSRGDRLAFTSGVVREVLYSRLSRRRRRSLHRRYAEILEQRHAGRLERVYPQLVHHFSEGDVSEKTVEYGLLQAKKALRAFGAEEAIRAAKTALEFFDEDWAGEPALEGEARMLLAAGHRMAAETDDALREIEAAIRIFEREGQSNAAVSGLLFAARTAWQARRADETRRWVERGLEAARRVGAAEHLRQLLSLGATLAHLRGEHDAASRFRQEAERLEPTAGEHRPQERLPVGGTLLVALANPILAREPADTRLVEEHEVFATAFETLLATDEEGGLVGALAETWEPLDGGQRFQLTLRPGIRFQDGTPLTAAEVKRSFERAIRRAASKVPPAFAAIGGFKSFVEGQDDELRGIEVHSERELAFVLREPLPVYPALLTDIRTAITRTSDGAPDALPIGSGPFRLRSLDRQRVVLERHREYWKGEPPRVEALEFRHGLPAAAIAAGLRSGELDLARDLLPRDLDDVLRDLRYRGRVIEVPQKTTYFVLFNLRGGPAARSEPVRQALAGVVRTQDLVWRTLGRYAQPATGFLPPGILGHDPGRRPLGLARDEARQRIAASGVERPLALAAAVHPLIQHQYGALLEALFAEWAQLGVSVAVMTPDMDAYLAAWEQNEALDVWIGRWSPDYNDPDNMTHTLFHSERGLLRAYFATPETDVILERARTESEPAAREALYRKFERLMLESGILIPLHHDVDYRVAGPKVRGARLSSIPPHVNYASLGKVEALTPLPQVRPELSGILRVPSTGEVRSLDPVLSQSAEQDEVLPSIYETLTRDMGEAQIVPWLAAEYSGEEGGRRWRFRLRDGVSFHDGRRVTARDVRYSLERLLGSRASRSRWHYSVIRGAKALLAGDERDLAGFHIHSASEFSIELERSVSFFPGLLAFTAAAIIPEGATLVGTNWKEGVVGTGPFRVVRFLPGRRLDLERNPTYWREGFPRSMGLVFHFGVPPKEILTGFRAGSFSLASDLYPEDVDALRREPAFAAGYVETPRLSTYCLAFNTLRGPLADRELRRRIVQALDVPGLVRLTLGRVAIPAQGLIPPGLVGHESAARPGAPAVSLPPSSAEVELAAAVHPVFMQEYAAFFEKLCAAMRTAGVRLRPTTESLGDLLEARQQSKVDIALVQWVADYPDADTFVHILQSREGFVGALCGSPELDQLIERGRAESDPAARHSVYRQVEELTAREARLLPLFHEQVYRFARPELGGLAVSYCNPAVSYESLSYRPTR